MCILYATQTAGEAVKQDMVCNVCLMGSLCPERAERYGKEYRLWKTDRVRVFSHLLTSLCDLDSLCVCLSSLIYSLGAGVPSNRVAVSYRRWCICAWHMAGV